MVLTDRARASRQSVPAAATVDPHDLSGCRPFSSPPATDPAPSFRKAFGTGMPFSPDATGYAYTARSRRSGELQRWSNATAWIAFAERW
jgi:hypothetical protein